MIQFNQELATLIKKTWFDPYNSYSIGIKSIYDSFTTASKEIFWEVLGSTHENTTFMNNHYNIIYSGDLIGNDDAILTSTANILIKLYQRALDDKTIIDKSKIQIVFKGHPRESSGYQQRIIDRINKIKPASMSDASNWFTVLKPTNPYEYYFLDGVFDNYPANDKVVRQYLTYSTILFFLDDADAMSTVEKIIIPTQKELNCYIEQHGKNSTIFPLDKVVLQANL